MYEVTGMNSTKSTKSKRGIYGDVSAACTTIHSDPENELQDELAAGIYGKDNAEKVNWEWLAIQDVLKAETKHRGAIEAILNIERDLVVREPGAPPEALRRRSTRFGTVPETPRGTPQTNAQTRNEQADVQVFTTQRTYTSQSANVSGFQH